MIFPNDVLIIIDITQSEIQFILRHSTVCDNSQRGLMTPFFISVNYL